MARNTFEKARLADCRLVELHLSTPLQPELDRGRADYDVNARFTFSKEGIDPDTVWCNLRVSPKGGAYYTVDASTVSKFDFEKGTPPAAKRDFFERRGVSLAYAKTAEIVSRVTGLGVYGPVSFPADRP